MARDLPSILDVLRVGFLMDADGRPVAEHQAAPRVQRGVDAGLVTCDYETSPSRYRNAKPMRQAGYEQVKDHFDEFLWLIDHLRTLCLGASGNARPTIADLRRMCFLGEDLARYLRLEAYLDRPQARLGELDDYRLPGPASVAFKSMRGILKLVDRMAERPREVLKKLPPERLERLGVARAKSGKVARDASLDLAWTGDDLLLLAEETGVLVGEHEVCAGTPSMIRRTLDTLMAGRAGEHDGTWIGELIGDEERLMRFSDILYEASPRVRGYIGRARERLRAIERNSARLNPTTKRAKVFKTHSEGLGAFLVSERRALEALQEHQAAVLALFDIDDPGPRLAPRDMNHVAPKNPRDLIETTYGAEVTYEPDAIRVAFVRSYEHADIVVPFTSA